MPHFAIFARVDVSYSHPIWRRVWKWSEKVVTVSDNVSGGVTDVGGGGGVVRRWGVGVRGCMQTWGPGRPAALTVSEDGPTHPRL